MTKEFPINHKIPRLNVFTIMTSLFLGLGVWLIIGSFMPSSVNAAIALNPYPNDFWIPSGRRSDLENCDGKVPRQSPAFTGWLSLKDYPSVTTATVDEGTASIDLRYHFAAAVCRTDSPTLGTLNLITSASDGASQLQGTAYGIDFGADNATLGAYRATSQAFTFSPTGGFNTSKNYRITLKVKSINQFTNGTFQCVGGNEAIVPNALSFQSCQEAEIFFDFYVDVVPKKPRSGIDANVDCKNLNGWGFDPDVPEKALKVDIWIDGMAGSSTGKGLTSLVADDPSNDVNLAFPLTKSSPHRFSYNYLSQINYTSSPARTFYIYFADYDKAGNQVGWLLVTQTVDIPSCGIPYELTPKGDVTLNPNGDDESPTSANFVNMSVEGASQPIKDVDISRKYYVVKIAQPTIEIDLGSPADDIDKIVTPAGLSFNNDINIPLPLPLVAGDKVCYRMIINPGEGRLTKNGGTLIAGSEKESRREVCIPVVDKPYVTFHGNDVKVGNGFDTGDGTCTSTAGTVKAFNKKNAQNQYVGSAVQLALTAQGLIENVSSGSVRSPLEQKPLTFANEETSDQYGGNFSNTGSCINNYFANYNPSAVDPLIPRIIDNNFPGGRRTRHFDGDLVIKRINDIPAGAKWTIYVKGNVVIEEDLTYAPWTTKNGIASLYLIVEGNISIAKKVTRLDGVYIAQPNPSVPSSGRIDTCTKSSGSSFALSELEANCRSSLTVYGNFIAQRVILSRIQNSLRNASPSASNGETWQTSQAAERFISSPEAFLVIPSLRPDQTETNSFDYFTTLPPIL